MVTMHGYGTREQCMSILFIAEKSKYAVGKKKKKGKEMQTWICTAGKKKKGKEMQTWICKRGSKQILSIINLKFYYLDVCVYICMYIHT